MKPQVSIQAERALLAGLIEDGEQVPVIASRLSAADFYDPKHGALFELLVALSDGGNEIDQVVVVDAVSANEEPYGGLDHVMGHTDVLDQARRGRPNTPVSRYAGIVLQKAKSRAIVHAAMKMIEGATAGKSPDLLGQQLTDKLGGILARGGNDSAHSRSLAEAMREGAEVIESPDTASVPWPWRSLEERIGRMELGDLVVLAEEPGTGKTTKAMAMLDHAARQGHGGVFFSLEMAAHMLGRRALATRSSATMGSMRRHRDGDSPLSVDAWESIVDAITDAEALPARIVDKAGLNMSGIRARLHQERVRLERGGHQLRLVVLDNASIIEAPGEGQDKLGDIAQACKNMAKDFGVIVVLLAQRNPESGKVFGSKVRVKAAADILLYGERDKDDPDRSHIITLTIDKSRNGGEGETVELYLDGDNQRVTETPLPTVDVAAVLNAADRGVDVTADAGRW